MAAGSLARAQYADIGTDADTNEKTLWSLTLPAGLLSADGRAIRVTAVVKYGANANTKTTRFKFGATTRVTNPSSAAPNNATQVFSFVIMRTGVSAQIMFPVSYFSGVTPQTPVIDTPAEDTTSAITVSITGQNGSAVQNDIVLKAAWWEMVN
jgi:hypothetical protein